MKADHHGHDCMQVPFPGDAAPLGTPPDEDCLVINVWRPASAGDGKRPVMVWLYGGGFVNGGASPDVYDGSQFAKKGVILVSFNYRVGRFGFFAFPALTAEARRLGEPVANYGYMDQIAALKWVQRNIAAFGGDKDNVTIFGESAGGGSVMNLLVSKAARGLFAKAIVESGGGRSSLMGDRGLDTPGPNGGPSAEEIGVNLAKKNGIEGTGADALAALRALPAETVLDGLNMATMRQAGDTYVGGPLADGDIMPGNQQALLESGDHARVPVIIGANSADIGFSFAQSMEQVTRPFGTDAAAVLKAYDPEGTGDVRAVGSAIAMDQTMIEPARFVVRTVSSQGLPAYEYRFSYVADSMRDQWKGAPHATEIPYVFDTVAAKYGQDLTAKDAAIADMANSYWVNFARTGNPNGPGLPEWPAYSKANDTVMDFMMSGRPRAMADPWKARLDLIEKHR